MTNEAIELMRLLCLASSHKLSGNRAIACSILKACRHISPKLTRNAWILAYGVNNVQSTLRKNRGNKAIRYLRTVTRSYASGLVSIARKTRQ